MHSMREILVSKYPTINDRAEATENNSKFLKWTVYSETGNEGGAIKEISFITHLSVNWKKR